MKETAMPETATAAEVINLVKTKDCKPSVRYDSDGVDQPKGTPNPPSVKNVYLNRTFAEQMPESITITVEAN
jgi:hypothetical protein